MLSASGLQKSFGQGDSLVHAVAGVDIEFMADEVVAIMGASGSGKTTLLHLLAGLLRPDGGSVMLGDRDLARLSDRELTAMRRSHVSVVFQAYNLLPTLTAIDNVAMPRLLAGDNRASARQAAQEMLALVGMAAASNRRPSQMSGGEQQRVAIARALVCQPQVLLADEPTGNLDRKNAETVCRLLRELGATAGRAVAMVTHDPIIAAHADRVVVLVDGRVADTFLRSDVGSAEELAVRAMTPGAGVMPAQAANMGI
ncbi:putative ABC transporter ATP-binding protein/MT1014 [Posidoniimonas corsicana]|uniref:Putative ABC transporter ATP-binding protein/MT1014 n=1 Tax=Posidoniimonas corsicana TaxID=1938618 RepID=A0A5C5VFD7_9BACT|nr:ABC transporter ATP-binding protein [Posidoniimonas corsicana]TWT36599.1 putative ABC transporter ATP-binding protein/MT1014 [Posidoniimonas corsicana]